MAGKTKRTPSAHRHNDAEDGPRAGCCEAPARVDVVRALIGQYGGRIGEHYPKRTCLGCGGTNRELDALGCTTHQMCAAFGIETRWNAEPYEMAPAPGDSAAWDAWYARKRAREAQDVVYRIRWSELAAEARRTSLGFTVATLGL